MVCHWRKPFPSSPLGMEIPSHQPDEEEQEETTDDSPLDDQRSRVVDLDELPILVDSKITFEDQPHLHNILLIERKKETSEKEDWKGV